MCFSVLLCPFLAPFFENKIKHFGRNNTYKHSADRMHSKQHTIPLDTIFCGGEPQQLHQLLQPYMCIQGAGNESQAHNTNDTSKSVYAEYVCVRKGESAMEDTPRGDGSGSSSSSNVH